MLAVIAVDTMAVAPPERTDMARVFAAFAREHEVVMACPGAAGCRQLVDELRQEMPRFRFVTMIVDGAVAADIELFSDLLERGVVPIAAVPDGQAREVAGELARRLSADLMLLCALEYPGRQGLRLVETGA